MLDKGTMDDHDAMENAKLISAISNPLRMRILEILAEKPLGVNSIVSMTSARQPVISANLSILSSAGLVDSQAMGRERIYRLCPEGLEEIAGWLDKVMHARDEGMGMKFPAGLSQPVKLSRARTCYDHLAGSEAVHFLDLMLKEHWLSAESGERITYSLTQRGENELSSRGISILKKGGSHRTFAYGCLDWTARSYHLGGTLGAAMLKALVSNDYVERVQGSREVTLLRELKEFF